MNQEHFWQFILNTNIKSVQIILEIIYKLSKLLTNIQLYLSYGILLKVIDQTFNFAYRFFRRDCVLLKI